MTPPPKPGERVEQEFDDIEWDTCFDCDGYGLNGHDCGEDTCCCLEPEENMICQTCDGEGGWEPTPAPGGEK